MIYARVHFNTVWGPNYNKQKTLLFYASIIVADAIIYKTITLGVRSWEYEYPYLGGYYIDDIKRVWLPPFGCAAVQLAIGWPLRFLPRAVAAVVVEIERTQDRDT
jgi:hypothetical protein